MSSLYPPLPSAPGAPMFVDQTAYQINAVSSIFRRYEVSDYYLSKINRLIGVEIVLILDDSPSMNQVATPSKYGRPQQSRWEELKDRIGVIIELGTVLDPDGIDIYFLNREAIPSVRTPDDVRLVNTFAHFPDQGHTPLEATYKRVISDKSRVLGERTLLIIIATDGEPNMIDSRRHLVNGMESFIKTLKSRTPIDMIPITIMACVNSESVDGIRTLKALNRLDKEVPNVDVVDDYESEREEILKVQGKDYHFTMGDYIVKTLLGGLDHELDNLDEPRRRCRCEIM